LKSRGVHGLRDFNLLFLGRILSTMSLQTQAVIVGWHVYELSKDALLLGLIGLAEALAAIGFAFVAGHIVYHRRPAMVYSYCLSVLVLNSIMIWSTTFAWLPWSATTRLVILFAGALEHMFRPYIQALFASFSPRSVGMEAVKGKGA